VIKWTKAFKDYLSHIISVQTIPLAYVIHPDEVVPAAAPPLEVGQPHSTEHSSVENKLVARASHAHALFSNDNSAVYHKLEEVTHTTQYAASIKPSNMERMAVVHGWLCTTNMLDVTSGKQRLRSRKTFCK
jgi:hypothetical protein